VQAAAEDEMAFEQCARSPENLENVGLIHAGDKLRPPALNAKRKKRIRSTSARNDAMLRG
jgi:hypothetical protein